MADNVTLDPGAGGAVIATDDDTVAQHQYVKMEWGADGTFNKVSTGADAVPIQDGGNTITVDGAVTVSGTATVSGVAAHDAVVSGNPIRVAAYAKAAAPTDVSADGDVVNIWADLAGRVQVGDGGATLSVDDGAGSLTIDAASLPLPTGASTAAKQPALGTAGTASTDVITVQGIAAMTALKVDGSGVTQPVSGTFWQATQPVSGTVAVTGVATAAKQDTAQTTLDTLAGAVRAEDAASADGHTGIPALAVRKATPANTSGLDGDYENLQINAGRLWASATIDAALPAGANAIGKLTANSGVDIGDVDVTSCALPTGASTAAKQPALGTAGTASADVITIQGIAAMTKLLVTPDSVALPANQSVNVNQLAGTTPDTNSGVKSAGTLRVVLATDQPALTNKLLVTPDSVALPANQSVNISQINGVTPLMGNGASGTGAPRVTIANDSTGILAGVTTVTTVTTCSTLTGGGIAHDGADSGNPLKVGFKAETSPKGITLVADGDRTDAYADADGLLMVKLNTSGADVVSEAVSNTNGSSTAFSNFSAVANTRNYITAYTAFRTDSGSTMAYVDLRDGTAGSVLWRIPLPPTGGAVSPPCSTPALFRTSANTALAFDVSSALTTVYISVSGYQSKV